VSAWSRRIASRNQAMLTGVVVLWCHSAASAAVTPSDIMEEVPIEIHNSSMINALLYEIGEKGDSGCDFDRLDLSSNPFQFQETVR
jgi:hypothetical protein